MRGRRERRAQIDDAWEELEANAMEQCRQVLHGVLVEKRAAMPRAIPTAITRVHVELDFGVIK